MAFKIQFTAAARRDILETTDYLQDKSPEYVSLWLNGVLAAARSLQEMPSRHALIWETDYLERPLHGLIYQSHRIVYEVDKTTRTVNIVRVYHSARVPLRIEDLD